MIRNASNSLDRLAARAQLTLAWERIWPSFAAVLVCVALFVSLSWFGLWLILPGTARMLGVGLFVLGAGAAGSEAGTIEADWAGRVGAAVG